MTHSDMREFVVLQVLQGLMSKRYRLPTNLQKEVCLLRVFEGILPRVVEVMEGSEGFRVRGGRVIFHLTGITMTPHFLHLGALVIYRFYSNLQKYKTLKKSFSKISKKEIEKETNRILCPFH